MLNTNNDEISTHYDMLEVFHYPNKVLLGQAAAAQAARLINAASSRQDIVSIILATGNSMLDFLGALRSILGIEWQRVNIFHMDEYLGMKASHPASFRRYLHEKIVDHVHPHAFFEIIGDAPDAEEECKRYEALLKMHSPILCCLGIGENGHLAFNDPPVADFNDPRWVKIVELDTACRMQQVGEGHFPSLETTPSHAITLTIPALLSAQNVLAIVPERRKAEAVRKAMLGPISTACPASILRKTSHAQLFLDNDSASMLTPIED